MSSPLPKKLRLDAAVSLELKPKTIKAANKELDKIEKELAEQLKKCCDEKGKETDTKESALLLHKLGQVYHKRSTDVFSLIRSAVLYNAALARDPSNKKIVQNDLQHLCSEILSLAGARNKNAQLLKQAKVVKQAVSEMRKRVTQRLIEIKIIPESVTDNELHFLETKTISSFQELQLNITDEYKKIMSDIANFCEEVMGEPPCKFALTGMGSIARREITPFSDFENIILLDNKVDRKNSYEDKLQYFRWFSVIFQTVLINLQETIVPSVAIDSLNNWFFDALTLRGISFDGMMPHACKFPLGRQPTKEKPFTTELIKPVDEMLNYLSSEENLKNGYHLSDILTKTCFVYKSRDIYEEFEKGVYEILESEKNQETALEEVKRQVIDDLQSFATRPSLLKLKSNEKFNVKQVVYRSTTLFISALGRIFNIRASSCFDIVSELHAKKHISDYARHKLMYGVALACEIRLRWYMKANKQLDSMDSIHVLIKQVASKRSAMSYFQIAYALQCDISKRLNLKRVHFFSSPTLFNLNLAHFFNDQECLNKMLHVQKRANPSQRLCEFDQCLKVLERQFAKSTVSNAEFEPNSSTTENRDSWKLFQKMGDLLHYTSCFDDAIDCYQTSTELLKQNKLPSESSMELERNFQINISINYRKIAYSLNFLGELENAKINAEKSLDILHHVSLGVDFERNRALSLKTYGYALSKLNQHEDAKRNLIQSLEILNQISPNAEYDSDVSEANHKLGRCYLHMNRLKESATYFNKSLQIQERISLDIDFDHKVSIIVLDLGRSLLKMNTLKEANNCIKRSLRIFERLAVDVDSDRDVSVALYNLGCCFLKMNELDHAYNSFTKSLSIAEEISLDLDSDREVADSLLELGCCLMKMGKLEKAKTCLGRSSQIKKTNIT